MGIEGAERRGVNTSSTPSSSSEKHNDIISHLRNCQDSVFPFFLFSPSPFPLISNPNQYYHLPRENKGADSSCHIRFPRCFHAFPDWESRCVFQFPKYSTIHIHRLKLDYFLAFVKQAKTSVLVFSSFFLPSPSAQPACLQRLTIESYI